MNDNIKYLQSSANFLQKNTDETIERAKDYQNDYENKCIDFTTDYLNVFFFINLERSIICIKNPCLLKKQVHLSLKENEHG